MWGDILSTVGDIMSTVGFILSTVGDIMMHLGISCVPWRVFSTMGGYHPLKFEYRGGYHDTCGGIS